MNARDEQVLSFRTITANQLKSFSRSDLLGYFDMCNSELRAIWNQLPTHLQEDPAFLVYQPNDLSKNESIDVNDGPTVFSKHSYDANDDPTSRHIICCFCKIRKLKIATQRRVYNLCNRK